VEVESSLVADWFGERSGSGEFLLIDEKEPEKVLLVVRTINSSAFSASDWEEYVYEVSPRQRVPA
jgi:hypothetical protein